MEFNATDKIAIAAAIPMRDATLIPVVNDFRASFTPPRISENFSFISETFPPLKKFSILSLTVFISPENFLAATNIPPPAKPAKISPDETLSEIHVNTFFTTSKICPADLAIAVPTAENTSPIDSTLPSAGSTALIISFKVLKIPSDRVVKNSSIPALSLSDVKKSPIDAETFNSMSTIPFSPPDPRKFLMGVTNATIPFLNRSTTEKTPLNVLLSLSAVSSLTLSPSVNEWNLSIIPLS